MESAVSDLSQSYTVTTALLSIIAVTLGYSVLRRYRSALRDKDLKVSTIPSLPRLPLVGSLPYLSTLDKFHLFLTSKSRQYGDVFSFYVMSQYTVVLNGYDAIRDTLVKKSADYAGRGDMYAVNKVWTDPGKGILFRDYGEEYRKFRTSCLTVLKTFGLGKNTVIESKIQTEIEHLIPQIRALNGQAFHPAKLLEYTAMNVIYSVMFNERFEPDDPTGTMLHEGSKTLADSTEVIYDLIPAVTYLPNVWRHLSNVRKIYNRMLQYFENRIEECKEAPVTGDNFIQEYVKNVGHEGYDRRELAVLMRDLILAGTETTSGQSNWALIEMANHPEVQERVQRDIDEVVPRDRLPSLDDRPRLAYVEATILEVMRLRTAVPLAAPHVTTTDTTALGHHVPANTTIIVNIYSAHMDPNVWDEPEKFRPERFLDESGNVCKREMVIPFSLGKRECLGEVLGKQEMFLIFSALMQQFRILPPEGETKVRDDPKFIRAMTAEPHLLRIVPREPYVNQN